MKDRAERFVVLPFSIGCTSDTSVALATTSQPPKKPKPESNPPATSRQEGEEKSCRSKMKSSSFLALPKPNIAGGIIHRVIRSIKSFSQIFVYKEEIEEMEEEMEIGYPTDVKHVTHIGLDGSTTTNPVKGWENLINPEILSFPSISLRQFELAMAAQTHEPLVVDPSKFS